MVARVQAAKIELVRVGDAKIERRAESGERSCGGTQCRAGRQVGRQAVRRSMESESRVNPGTGVVDVRRDGRVHLSAPW